MAFTLSVQTRLVDVRHVQGATGKRFLHSTRHTSSSSNYFSELPERNREDRQCNDGIFRQIVDLHTESDHALAWVRNLVDTIPMLAGLTFGTRVYPVRGGGERTIHTARLRVLALRHETLVAGTILLVVGGVHKAFTKRSAILPSRLFKSYKDTNNWMSSGNYLSPQLRFPPNSVCLLLRPLVQESMSSAFSIASGFLVSKMGKNLPAIWFGSTLITVGTGLLMMLDYASSICSMVPNAEQEVFPLVAAIGAGFLFHVPLVALQAAMPMKDIATATSGFMFLRVLGGAVGLSIGEAIIASMLPRKLVAIPNIASLGIGDTISDVTLRNEVLHAWARSIATIWMVTTALAGVALISTLFLREYSVDRKTVYSGRVGNSGESENVQSTSTVTVEGEGSEESGEKRV
ncbi:hypothetical protein OG21DRAFT_1525132 [Imleria badia]|nr:hypothetical protein OG21DRAFT_1525132 [Imleria badia]